MQGVVRFKFSSEPKPNRLIITLSISDSQNWFKYPEFKKLYVCHHSETVLRTIGNVTVPWTITGSHELKWSAPSRGLFRPNSVWGSKETTAIRKTSHFSHMQFVADYWIFLILYSSLISNLMYRMFLVTQLWPGIRFGTNWWASKYDFKSVFCYVRSTLVPS